MAVELKIKRLHNDVTLPEYATKGSAAFDIRAFFNPDSNELVEGRNPHNKDINMPVKLFSNGKRGVLLPPQFKLKVPTGLILDIPKGFYVELFVRSSVSFNYSLKLANAVPVIDSDYTDELFLLVENTCDTPVTINSGDRYAQAILKKIERTKIVETVDEIEQKEDRVGGIGSTGME